MQGNIKFIGRGNELGLLRELIDNQRSTVGVVFGRRRIGKSYLIEKALEGKRAIIIDGLENRPKKDQIDNFLFQLALHSGTRPHKFGRKASWRESFYLLSEEVKKNPCHIVLDEFQWMANYRSEIVSDLKLIWDRYLSKIQGITLILCGSIASFMITKIVKSSAFYGRTDLQIHLKAFMLSETAQYLERKGTQEILEAHLVTGGVPKYLQILSEKPSIRIGLEQEAFTESGYFALEYDRIFTSHFGKNPEFENIIQLLADHPYGLFRKQLCEKAHISLGGGVSRHLADLEAAGFISSQTPFNAHINSRYAKYFLHDAYLRFYFAFIRPNLKEIQSGLHTRMLDRFLNTPAYFSWMGRSFEHLCFQHAAMIADILRFSGIKFSCGPFFQAASSKARGVQIDLLYSRADNVLTMCEIKYSSLPVGISVIEETEKKAQALRMLFPRKTVQPVLITFQKATRELEVARYFHRLITADELL